jgi:ABC-type dipeptide/oligopeptide/nickel transport system permease component
MRSIEPSISELAVIWKHAFYPIRVQLVTVIGLSYAVLLEGSVMVEIVFSWPGIVNYSEEAQESRILLVILSL